MQPNLGQDGLAKNKEVRKRTPIHVPPSARERKAKFAEEPSRAKVLEIVRHVVATGEAHTHPDVTYQPIAKGTDVVFLDVFSIHEKFAHDEEKWCLCAACPHDYPQFKNDGVLLWVRYEHTVKIVGWHCFKRHDPEAHARAAKQYEADDKARKNESYLIDHLCLVPGLIGSLSRDIAIATAVDRVRALLARALVDHGLDELPRHIKKGKLRLEERAIQYDYRTGSRRSVTHKKDHASVRGADFLHLKGNSLYRRLMRVQEMLSAIYHDDNWDGVITSMSDREKAWYAQTFGTALKEWTAARKDLDEMRHFIRPVTGKTLQHWSSLPGCTFPFFYKYSEELICIGRSDKDSATIEIPLVARAQLATLPSIVGSRRATTSMRFR